MARGDRAARETAVWRRVMESAEKCLEMDRGMLERVEASKRGGAPPADPDEYLDPSLWENFVEARRELIDFTSSSIEVLTRDPQGEPARPSEEEVERRLIGSLTEMAELEEKLAAYLSQNLDVLAAAIGELTRNQTLFSRYAKSAAKPEPGYLSSQA
jgi:hypothetical protein